MASLGLISIALTFLVGGSFVPTPSAATAEAPAPAAAATEAGLIVEALPPGAPHASTYWNYALAGSDWTGLCAKGRRQSPINIVPSNETIVALARSKAPHLAFGTGDNVTVYNTGHTLQVEWTPVVKPNITVRLADFLGQPNATGPVSYLDRPGEPLGDADERLAVTPLQWHIHYPSEHTLNGKLSAIETHLVAALPGTAKFPFCSNETGCNAVFAVLYDISDNLTEASPFLTPFFNHIPEEVGKDHGVRLNGTFELRDFFPADSHFIGYTGSLTTPPCTQNVLWSVDSTARKMSVGQLTALQLGISLTETPQECYRVFEGTKYGDDTPFISGSPSNEVNMTQFQLCAGQGNRANNRLPQPLNGRTLWTFSEDAATN